jgi:hypothetical protein
MPIDFLTEMERARLNRFPVEISSTDLIKFFTLSATDGEWVSQIAAPHNRLGLALQLCTLRYLGFCPDELKMIPTAVITYVANQLGVDPKDIVAYRVSGSFL